MAKLNPKKQKKSSFYEEKSLVGLTPALKKMFGANFLIFWARKNHLTLVIVVADAVVVVVVTGHLKLHLT